MKESHRENLASSSGHEPYAGSSNVPGVAWASGDAGQPLSSEIKVPVCRPCTDKGKAASSSPLRQGDDGHGGVVESEHASKFQAREPGGSNSICGETVLKRGFKTYRRFHVSDAKDQMDVIRQSYGSVVSTKSANNGASEASAEWMEKRNTAKRNADQANPPQAQNRDKVGQSGLERVREAARKDGKLKFVSLLHHADVDSLRRSFYQLKKPASHEVKKQPCQIETSDLASILAPKSNLRKNTLFKSDTTGPMCDPKRLHFTSGMVCEPHVTRLARDPELPAKLHHHKMTAPSQTHKLLSLFHR